MKSFGQFAVGKLEHTPSTINGEVENQWLQMLFLQKRANFSFYVSFGEQRVMAPGPQVTLETPSGVHEFECPPDVS